MLDFPRSSELHSLFQILLKYKAALPEIMPPLEENSTETSKISINLTTKQILLNSKGLPRQQVFNISIMSTGRKYGKFKSSALS